MKWFRCAIGLHNYNIYCEEKVYNIRAEVVGTNYVLQCQNCGKIQVKFISNMIEEIKRY